MLRSGFTILHVWQSAGIAPVSEKAPSAACSSASAQRLHCTATSGSTAALMGARRGWKRSNERFSPPTNPLSMRPAIEALLDKKPTAERA